MKSYIGLFSLSPNRRYSGHHRRRGRPTNTWRRDLEKEMWTDRQQDTSTDGGRWRRQHKTELDGVVCAPMFHRERQGISRVSQVK